VNFFGAVAADVGPKHDEIWRLSMHALLVQITGKQFDVATSAVNLLLMFHSELYYERLSLTAERLVKLG